jgi:hypothetical protein
MPPFNPNPTPTEADRQLYQIVSGIIYPASIKLDTNISYSILQHCLLFRELSALSPQQQHEEWQKQLMLAQRRYAEAALNKPTVLKSTDKAEATARFLASLGS